MHRKNRGATAVRRQCPRRLVKTLAVKRKIESSKANAVAKKVKLPAKNTEESTATDGKRLELDEHTTQLLEEELQTIMIKVWQALPDSPPSAAERYVAERFRNEASDDIRNVLGLNVTKRLLNVYNPLFLKLTFSGTPEEHDLRRFQRAFNISEMEGPVGARGACLARVHDIADFDRLCKGKEFPCGKATITVSPRYRFQICPVKMTTGFIKKIKTAPKPKSGESSTDIEKDVADKKSNDETVSQATTNSEKKQETVTSKPISKNEQIPKTNIEKKNESVNNKVSPQSNVNKINVVKKNIEVDNIKQNNIIATNKGTDPKPNVVKGTQNVGQTATQSNASKPKSTHVTEAAAVKNVNVEKTSTPTSVSKSKPNVASPTVATKKITEETPKSIAKTTAATNLNKPKQNPVHKVVATKTVTESIPKLIEKSSATTKQGVATKKIEPTTKSPVKSDGKPNATKPKPNQVKGVVANKKVVESKQPKLSIKNAVKINSEIFVEEEDEDEEMDDEEILALISSGVVVDECSGSEED